MPRYPVTREKAQELCGPDTKVTLHERLLSKGRERWQITDAKRRPRTLTIVEGSDA